jgi:PadR family transcriptional regulator
MIETRSAILQGTLDLMVLKTLEQMGPLHGYGIARRIEQVGEQAVIVNQGTIYLCLVRLLQKRWISARWGTSENNRKAKFYAITKAGRAQLKAETENWERISGVIGRVLRPEGGLPAVALAKAGS